MLVYGKNVCDEVIKHNIKIKKAYISDNFSDKYLLDEIYN